jgi:hypothetical protein
MKGSLDNGLLLEKRRSVNAFFALNSLLWRATEFFEFDAARSVIPPGLRFC